MMATDDLLEQVKTGMLITGDFQDNMLRLYINEVLAFLESAGANPVLLNTQEAVGLITRGVIDLWNYGAGDAKLSDYFIQRAIQLIHTEI
jgi:hypothetical protein